MDAHRPSIPSSAGEVPPTCKKDGRCASFTLAIWCPTSGTVATHVFGQLRRAVHQPHADLAARGVVPEDGGLRIPVVVAAAAG